MGMTTEDFIKDAKRRMADIVQWREDGKIIGFVHPSGFHKRVTYYLPTVTEVKKKGKVKFEISKTSINCPGKKAGCPLCELRDFLRNDADIEEDDVIFKLGKGKNKLEILKGNILGLKDFPYQESITASKEFLFGWIDVDNIEAGSRIMNAGAGFGRAISSCIEDKIDEDGRKKGDPTKTPWAMKFTYKESEPPATRYGCRESKAELTEEIQELLDEDGPDLNALVSPASPKEIWKLLKDFLVIDFTPSFLDKGDDDEDDEGNGDDNEDDDNEDDEEEKKSKKKKKVKKEKKTKKKKVVDDDDDEDNEDDDSSDDDESDDENDDEEEKPKKKKKVKKIKKEKKKKKKKVSDDDEDTEPCPRCGEDIPLSATKCPDCGQKFLVDDDDDDNEDNDNEDDDTMECPYCEEDIPKKNKSGKPTRRCPECGEKIK